MEYLNKTFIYFLYILRLHGPDVIHELFTIDNTNDDLVDVRLLCRFVHNFSLPRK